MNRHRERLEMLHAWALHDVALYRAFLDAVNSVVSHPRGSRVLDVGCGANAPMTVALHAAGYQVTGIDVKIGHRWGLGFRPSRYADYLKQAGAFATMRKALGELVYDRRYYQWLGEGLGLRLADDGLDLREMKAAKLDFEDGIFDLIHSNATWEHLKDVAAANREVARLLKPGGLAYIEIHLFPSLSGGHDLSWIVPGKKDIPIETPWRHLRDPSWTAPVYLNRLRERDYRRNFEETPLLEVVSWQTEYVEGEEHLTDAILTELGDYTREELTKRSIIVMVRRRAAASGN